MPTTICKNKKNAGFTLAEMAIVVLLIGIMLSMGVGLLSTQTENAAITLTKQREDAIKNALVAYLRANWRLPCPDRTFAPPTGTIPNGSGDDDRTTAGSVITPCTGGFGLVPYLDLGLPKEMAQDGWGNFFSYHVTTAPTNWALTASFNPAAVGAITVNSRPPSPTPLTTNAVAVIVSHGKNGTGAYTIKGTRNLLPTGTFVDELENTDANTTYFKRDYSADTAASGGAFDDIVTIIQANDLLLPLRNDGTIKVESDKLAAAQNVAITSSFATCVLPSPLTLTGYQAYGQNITYARNFIGTMSIATTPGTTIMFTLTIGTVAWPIPFSQIIPVLAAYGKCP